MNAQYTDALLGTRSACKMAVCMEVHSLELSRLPHPSKLFAAFLENFDRVSDFFWHSPTLESISASARTVQLPVERLGTVVSVLRAQNERLGADPSVMRNLDRLAAGAVAVVTGQQVGLLGGPAYSVYKALTTVRLAQELTRIGLDAVPVFWMATEDHDFHEVSRVDWLAPGGQLKRLTLEIPAALHGRPVGHIVPDESLRNIVESACQLLTGPAQEAVARAIAESYQPGVSLSDAFGRLMACLLAGRGLILLDPLEPKFHALAAPVFGAVIEEAESLNQKLVARGKALESAGFHTQVKVTGQTVPLFLLEDGYRKAVRLRNNGFVVGLRSYTGTELLGELDRRPADFSGTALFRPVIQDYLLPTVAIVAGPAEIAYFAQSHVLYRELLGRMPVIVPRAGFTLVEPAVARLLQRYRLSFEDVLQGLQNLQKQMARARLPADLKRRFATSERQIGAQLERLREALVRLDPTLGGAADTARRKILYQVGKLRDKAARAEEFRHGVLDRHRTILLNSLFPHHGLQERTISLLPFASAFGMSLLEDLQAISWPHPRHHLVFL